VRALAIAVALAPTSAHAGRTFYGWLYGTETLPERGVELVNAIDERNVQFSSVGDHETTWRLTTVVGITDQLELGLPIESKWYSEEAPSASFAPYAVVPRRYGAELRYRFVADGLGAFVPLARVALVHDVTGALRCEGDAVVSYQRGRVHALADAGLVADFATRDAFSRANGDHHVEAHPGVGVSIRAVGDLRFGAEVHAEWALDANESGHTWGVAGPNASWTYGRFWASAVYGIGVYGIRSAPRVVWGVTM
jgi:hypothetical protein